MSDYFAGAINDPYFGSSSNSAASASRNSFAGGMDTSLNLSDSIGRLWNNISGKSAETKANLDEAERNRVFNHDEAFLDREWKTEMSNTAYQRQVADMQAAGINPATAAGSGGASTPSGQPAQGTPGHSGTGGGSNLGAAFFAAIMSTVSKVAAAKIAAKAATANSATAAIARGTSDATKADAMIKVAEKKAQSAAQVAEMRAQASKELAAYQKSLDHRSYRTKNENGPKVSYKKPTKEELKIAKTRWIDDD